MQQIADRVHVHVTTVSRAVDDKWVQTPRGIFALKRFFGGGTTTADGEEVAWDTIKQKLLEIIAKEDKGNPLSDEEIVEELARSGFPVARRTVTNTARRSASPPAGSGAILRARACVRRGGPHSGGIGSVIHPTRNSDGDEPSPRIGTSPLDRILGVHPRGETWRPIPADTPA
jgi:hypothetical protein